MIKSPSTLRRQLIYALLATFGIGLIVAVVIGVYAVRTALIAEENLQAFFHANRATLEYVQQNEGQWPKSWDDLRGIRPESDFDWVAEHLTFDFNADQWSAKWTNKFKLPADFDIEVTGHYRSKVQTVQGTVSGNVFADLGVRKKIMDGRGVLNLSVRDVFASRIRESEATQPGFYLYNFNQRGRFITLGFSYGFGKGEAMEFGGQKGGRGGGGRRR